MPSSPTADPLDAAWRVVVDGADRGAYPGAVAVVAHRGRVVLRRAVGWAVVEPDRVPMTDETVFDLASLTKVVATLPAVLRLVVAGALALDDPLGAHLPAFGLAGAKRGVTIRRLLAHHAGLTAWRPLYLDHIGPAAYLAAIAASEPSAPPGEVVVYSDLGFVLLGELIRRLSGDDVATFAARELFAPLGMTDAGFLPPAALLSRIAATERGNRTEHGMCGPRAAGFGGWRTGVIRGQVNDGNAWYGLGGVAGHAGLFATAADLARYGRFWLDRGELDGHRFLPAPLVDEATRPQASGRGLGWVLHPLDPAPKKPGDAAPADAPPHPAATLSPRAYGHTGFTGTSLWLDPDRDLVAVLLTNRLHPEARPEIAAVRAAFHAALAAAISPNHPYRASSQPDTDQPPPNDPPDQPRPGHPPT